MSDNNGHDCMAHARQFLTDEVRARGRPKQQRSRITNGREFIRGLDNRGPWIRRARDVQSALVNDRGGPAVVSSAETLIARRAAVLEAELERMEGMFAAASKATDSQIALYSTLANTQRRLLEAVGLERRARDVTPVLQAYIHKPDDAAEVIEGSAA